VGRRTARRPEPLRPLHHAGDAQLEGRRDRSAALTRRNRRHNALAKIKGISSGHPMLASNPASILNHIRAKPGIFPIQKKSATL